MLANKIVEAVRSVIGDGPHALHEPLFIGNEQKYTADAIASGWVAQGDYIERFEQMLCDFTGAKYAVATCSATCALEAATVECGYRHEVAIPSLTFVATANALVAAGGIPKFVEHEDAEIGVNLVGMPLPWSDMQIYDAAQALGTDIAFGSDTIACFSFNGNKIITTGGGGAAVTNDKVSADFIRSYTRTGRIPHEWRIEHEMAARNYRMPNINAALGCAQMEQLPYILKAKRALAQKYIDAFDAIGVKVWKEPEGTTSNYWLVSIVLDDPDDQEPALGALHNAGYQARMLPTPLHMLPMFKNCLRMSDLSRSEDLWRRTICLPSSPELGVKYA